ncbi:MAG: hypothetical protein JWM74_1238 [Myxococcaceae bacterium]|nr:hypothetical protein [Myxococcaceae bacterium]
MRRVLAPQLMARTLLVRGDMRIRTTLFPLLAASFSMALALSFLGSTCDTQSDECSGTEHRCEGNTTVNCNKPGEEVHRRIERVDCTQGAVCTMTSTHGAACVRSVEACQASGQNLVCKEDIVSKCASLTDGGTAWADDFACDNGRKCISNDASTSAYCK